MNTLLTIFGVLLGTAAVGAAMLISYGNRLTGIRRHHHHHWWN